MSNTWGQRRSVFATAMIISWLVFGQVACSREKTDVRMELDGLFRHLVELQAEVIVSRSAVIRAAEFRPDPKEPSVAESAYAKAHPESWARGDSKMAADPSGESSDEGVDLRSALPRYANAQRMLAQAQSKYLDIVERHLSEFRADETARYVRRALIMKPSIEDKAPWISKEFQDPSPMDFEGHTGFVQVFDGKTLEGWDGDPSVWRVENGEIVGSTDWTHPTSNTYIAYKGMTAKDFDLKLEIKVEGNGGSGIQYRSVVGVPFSWSAPGMDPTDPKWLMTGPQADFWPLHSIFTGQMYSENTPLRILAWRGQVVNSFPGQRAQLVAKIGDRVELGNYIRLSDWNQYEILARGGVMLHVINGQLMAVEIDDDPKSSNNREGLIGIEIEMIPSKVEVRDIWLRKLSPQ